MSSNGTGFPSARLRLRFPCARFRVARGKRRFSLKPSDAGGVHDPQGRRPRGRRRGSARGAGNRRARTREKHQALSVGLRYPRTSIERTEERTVIDGRSYDAIVIGGGHNGLVTAAYLGRAGRRVLVLERRHILGGATVTEEVFPGVKFTVCSYVCSLLRPEIIRDLDLPSPGYQIIPVESTLRSPRSPTDGTCTGVETRRRTAGRSRISRSGTRRCTRGSASSWSRSPVSSGPSSR